MSDTEAAGRRRGAAVGTFDGVHLGHLAVLKTLKEASEERGLEPMAVSFDRHPLSVICPQRAPQAITGVARRCELLRKAGVTPVILTFDEKMRSTTAADWMRMMHVEYGVQLLVVGYDNTFGSDGLSLSIADYRAIGREAGIEVISAPVVEGVSSSAVRKAIAGGDVAAAAQMLGRKFTLPGIVVEGNKLGRTIGFPTANVFPEPGLVVPGNGVYAAALSIEGGPRLPAVVNVGVRPTVRRGETRTIEAHIIGWHGDIYGKNVGVSFFDRIREEKTFNSIAALRTQIEKDAAYAKDFLEKTMKAGK